jgi:hypothetical protein
MVCKATVLRNIYRMMLLEFEIEAVRRFWSENPLRLNDRQLSEQELFTLLWNGTQFLPFHYVTDIFIKVERFILAHGSTVEEFAEKIYSNSPLKGFYDLKELISCCRQDIADIFRGNEPCSVLAGMLEHSFSEETPDGHIVLLRQQTKTNFFKLLFLMSFGPASKATMIYFDVLLWTVPAFKYWSSYFGPSIDSAALYADCRPIECITDGYPLDIVIRDGFVYCNNRIVGEKIDFFSFFRTLAGESDMIVPVPVGPCFIITENIYCPTRKRNILHKGCVYGAPFYLYEYSTTSRFMDAFDADFLVKLLEKEEEYKRQNLNKLMQKHAALIAVDTSCQMVFRFNAVHRKLFYNNNELIRGISALLVKEMLSAFIYEKKNEFHYKEFIGHRQLTSNPKKPNLSLRLKRISQTLQKECPDLCMERLGKGRFRLTALKQVFLFEE